MALRVRAAQTGARKGFGMDGPPSLMVAAAVGLPPVMGLGTTIVAALTPTGRLTESETVPPMSLQDDEIMPFGERNCPRTNLGPTLSWMRGMRLTSAKPDAAGVSPTRCFHSQWLQPGERKQHGVKCPPHTRCAQKAKLPPYVSAPNT